MRHLRTGFDLEDRDTLQRVLVRAQLLKRQRVERRLAPSLSGRVIGMLFHRPSTRTRASFEAGIALLGGATVVLHGRDTQLQQPDLLRRLPMVEEPHRLPPSAGELSEARPVGEPLRDAARVLGGYVDALVVRMQTHDDMMELARHARVPVVNGLSQRDHPCQAVTDVLTVFERRERPFELKWAYVGEVTGAMHGLIAIAALAGIALRVALPRDASPDAAVWSKATSMSKTVTRADSAVDAVKGADVICTDAWPSIDGLTPPARAARIAQLQSFRVDAALLHHAADEHLVLHPLPAHRGLEITDDVLEGMRSVAFEQANNRLCAQQALMELLLGVG